MIEGIFTQYILPNWQRKLSALLIALAIWAFVQHSITETKTIANVRIRILNLPSDKTVVGLLANGMLSRRLALTLSGSKRVIDQLEASDLEVHLDASSTSEDDWVVHIGKKQLFSLQPSIDLQQEISSVSHPEFVIKISPLVSVKVPIHINAPRGVLPSDWEFLDVWPQQLYQNVSGPQSEVDKLQSEGLIWQFDLDTVTLEELIALGSSTDEAPGEELSYAVPKKWKVVAIPFREGALEEMNDPDAQFLRVNFLRRGVLAIDIPIAIRVFYPLATLSALNPESFPLLSSKAVRKEGGIGLWQLPLYVHDVSRLFLDIVKASLEITIIAAPKEERRELQWGVDLVGMEQLEDTYVAFVLASAQNKNQSALFLKRHEALLRKRFRGYIYKLYLYGTREDRLRLHPVLSDKGIELRLKPHG